MTSPENTVPQRDPIPGVGHPDGLLPEEQDWWNALQREKASLAQNEGMVLSPVIAQSSRSWDSVQIPKGRREGGRSASTLETLRTKGVHSGSALEQKILNSVSAPTSPITWEAVVATRARLTPRLEQALAAADPHLAYVYERSLSRSAANITSNDTSARTAKIIPIGQPLGVSLREAALVDDQDGIEMPQMQIASVAASADVPDVETVGEPVAPAAVAPEVHSDEPISLQELVDRVNRNVSTVQESLDLAIEPVAPAIEEDHNWAEQVHLSTERYSSTLESAYNEAYLNLHRGAHCSWLSNSTHRETLLNQECQIARRELVLALVNQRRQQNNGVLSRADLIQIEQSVVQQERITLDTLGQQYAQHADMRMVRNVPELANIARARGAAVMERGRQGVTRVTGMLSRLWTRTAGQSDTVQRAQESMTAHSRRVRGWVDRRLGSERVAQMQHVAVRIAVPTVFTIATGGALLPVIAGATVATATGAGIDAGYRAVTRSQNRADQSIPIAPENVDAMLVDAQQEAAIRNRERRIARWVSTITSSLVGIVTGHWTADAMQAHTNTPTSGPAPKPTQPIIEKPPIPFIEHTVAIQNGSGEGFTQAVNRLLSVTPTDQVPALITDFARVHNVPIVNGHYQMTPEQARAFAEQVRAIDTFGRSIIMQPGDTVGFDAEGQLVHTHAGVSRAVTGALRGKWM